MLELLKADLKRALKDKLFLIVCIIAGAFALVTPLLYKGIELLLATGVGAMEGMEAFNLTINAKTMFFSSFSLGNNFGFILPIMVAIILCKDFSHGTIRNKIVCGKSRASIYFSLLITCAILMCALILAHAVLSLLVSLIFFEYQSAPFTLADFGYMMASIGLEMVVYLFVCALLTFFIVISKNAGLAIVWYFVVSFVLMIIGSVIQATIMMMNPDEITYKILEFVNVANAFTTTTIGGGATYQLKELLYILLPNLVVTVALILLGLLLFKKKDLK